jgi:hypothetical protein
MQLPILISLALSSPLTPSLFALNANPAPALKLTAAIPTPGVLAELNADAPAAPADAAQSKEALAQAAKSKQHAIQKVKFIFREEPSIKEVQDWTLRLYRLEPSRINSMASAAQLKGLVPEVQGSFSNLTGNTFTSMKDGLYIGLPLAVDGSTCSGGNSATCGYKELTAMSQSQLTWQVNATWALDKLVFNSEALDARSTVSLEETLIREVTTMFFSRRRLIASLILSPPDSEEEAFYEQLRIEEMTANLDSFTDGQFGKRAFRGDLTAK